MKMNLITKILFILLFLCNISLIADISLSEIDTLKTALIMTYNEYIEAGITREVDLYPLALCRLNRVTKDYADDPQSEEAQREFEIVKFLTEAARVQMLAAKNYAISLDLQEETESTLREINSIRTQINDLKLELAEKKETNLSSQLARQRAEAESKLFGLENEMIKIEEDVRGTIISMSDLLFKINSAELSSDMRTNLAKIGGILLVYPDLEITIEGHTDNVGTLSYNQKLSQERALNVRNFLADMGVGENRMEAIGCAFSKPVADNSTPEGRNRNRRVDIIIKS